ncbi:hypothetical protein SAMN06269185_1179 [Natronoarchaeum philippinense]|uniref:Uncharacterized protein n=1 Tax=Natronoarchaeum philippinense TaxID=558529 RepID=A0A285NC27_NATPI|nr:hypothetical protein [Natronoarchaeum philippinense]SNZ06463.1 hypothetical protein SAMN06269185_1179 [Natronoarchaeum philippinense]
MRRLFFALLLATAAVLAMGMGAGGAIAQESTANASAATQIEANASTDVTCERVVDSQTCVTDWSYAEGTFTLTFWSEADSPQTIGLTEASDWSKDSKRFAYSEKVITSGETSVTFTVYQRDGAGVGIMSETAREAEQGGAVISTATEDVQANPLKTFGGESGLFTGVIMTIVLAALSAWYVVRSENTGVIEA